MNTSFADTTSSLVEAGVVVWFTAVTVWPRKGQAQGCCAMLPLVRNPQRLGKTLGAELTGIYAARGGQQWRVLYEIDEAGHVVTVLDIRHRATVYRRR